MYRTQNRYYSNAKKTKYDGEKYDSKFEAGYAQELTLRKRAGDIAGFDRQVNIDLIVNGFKVCTYRIDFVVYHNDGSIEYAETKGVPTPYWVLKWKLFEALYSKLPDVKLTVINQGKFRRPKIKKVKV